MERGGRGREGGRREGRAAERDIKNTLKFTYAINLLCNNSRHNHLLYIITYKIIVTNICFSRMTAKKVEIFDHTKLCNTQHSKLT